MVTVAVVVVMAVAVVAMVVAVDLSWSPCRCTRSWPRAISVANPAEIMYPMQSRLVVRIHRSLQ